MANILSSEERVQLLSRLTRWGADADKEVIARLNASHAALESKVQVLANEVEEAGRVVLKHLDRIRALEGDRDIFKENATLAATDVRRLEADLAAVRAKHEALLYENRACHDDKDRLTAQLAQVRRAVTLLMAPNGHFYDCIPGKRGQPLDDECSAACRQLRATLTDDASERGEE